MEIISFNSQARLTPFEQIIKYCLKLVSRNCQYCVPDEMAAAFITHNQYYHSWLHYIICHLISHIPVQSAVCKEVQSTVFCSLSNKYSLIWRIFIAETYIRMHIFEKFHRKLRIQFPSVSVASQS